jgi:amidase
MPIQPLFRTGSATTEECEMGADTRDLRTKFRALLDKASSASSRPGDRPGPVTRRDFLQLGAVAGAGASLSGTSSPQAQTQSEASGAAAASQAPDDFNEATIAQLQAAMAKGRTSAVELTSFYLKRIQALDEKGPHLNSVIELNPDAIGIAQHADAMRRQGRVLGPLHGIPILLKDNIDTGDRMQTTAGSFALAGRPAVRDSTVAAKLRAGGAVILGKANLSEWANFRSTHSTSGWTGRGGQTNNPYALDRNPCGSSSGSAAAVSANLSAVSLGSETDGSIVCPSNASGVVGLKPTVGLTSRAGVVPIAHTQDTIGPHARTVADAAAVLTVIASQQFDGRDPATGGVPLGWRGRSRPVLPTNYMQFVNRNGLAGARIGVSRQGIDDISAFTGAVFDNALDAMQAAGATLVDLDEAGFTFPPGDGELLVLLFEFVDDVRQYLATRVGVPAAGKTLADLIAFNNAHAAIEMPFFGQEIFEIAEALEPGPDTPQPAFGMSYNEALEIDRRAGVNGIDAALTMFHLDAIAMPTGTPVWPTDLINGDRFEFGSSGFAAVVGYPIINVPMGNVFGVPLGISFMSTAFSEPALIRVAAGFEHATKARIVPQFFPTLPRNNVSGVPLTRRRHGAGHSNHKRGHLHCL